eukprot:3205249-Rhodomonas_salina.2
MVKCVDNLESVFVQGAVRTLGRSCCCPPRNDTVTADPLPEMPFSSSCSRALISCSHTPFPLLEIMTPDSCPAPAWGGGPAPRTRERESDGERIAQIGAII